MATSFIGPTLERKTLVHYCLSMVDTMLICLRLECRAIARDRAMRALCAWWGRNFEMR
jgi:hypothetical protein